MNPADMSNEQLADKYATFGVHDLTYTYWAKIVLDEMARRLRAAATVQEGCVSKALYDAAWNECLVSREKFRVSCDNGGPFFCVPIAPPTLLEIVDARTSHDATREAASKAVQDG